MRAIQTINLSDTLSLSECKDGWWLYDKAAGMNLAMKAASERQAFIEALSYYQDRTQELSADSSKRQQFMESLYDSLFDEFGDHDAIKFASEYR